MMVEQPINRKVIMSVMLSSEQLEQVEDLAQHLILLGTSMTTGVKNNPDHDPPAFLVELTGTEMIEAASELLSVIAGTDRTSKVLTVVQQEMEMMDNMIQEIRDSGKDPLEYMMEQMEVDVDDWRDDQGYDDC
jgi:hypothetical protein